MKEGNVKGYKRKRLALHIYEVNTQYEEKKMPMEQTGDASG